MILTKKSRPTSNNQSWTWQQEGNEPTIWTYTEIPGVKEAALQHVSTSIRELDVFYVIFNSTFWENIATETNRYAQDVLNIEQKRRKIDQKLSLVGCNEIKIYVALCTIMAEVRKPLIQMYWSRRAVIETPIFRKTMPFRRFLHISRFLHLANNSLANNTDKLYKLRPVIDMFNQKFKEVYTMQENIPIDESLMKFKGRLSYKQFIPSKRTRFGIIIYKLCRSSSGYCYDFKIYTGSDKCDASGSDSESIVLELSQSLLHNGYTLYLDNWFSSPKLFKTLFTNKTNVIGTVLSNRKNMPTESLKAKLKKTEYTVRSCNGILALKWKDKRDVYMFSTKHSTAEMIATDTPLCYALWKPKCVIEYNRGMIGIDRQDQML
ncbi:piggyBac transposable element-derived protein 4-like [Schistocerca americana]|uniref:piggyBac transposable element-derived protein 4-like n=1 Tax=Schistocerca americana TaxID=7009 RepID=UPI001F4FA507|nr:piggyBac transposable element-derived protein 4-like [Schistocerca americana]